MKDDRKQGTRLTELRRSNASGTHGKRSKDRANMEREAIEEATNDPDEDVWTFLDGFIASKSDLEEYLEESRFSVKKELSTATGMYQCPSCFGPSNSVGQCRTCLNEPYDYSAHIAALRD